MSRVVRKKQTKEEFSLQKVNKDQISETAKHLCITWKLCRSWQKHPGNNLFFSSAFNLHLKEYIQEIFNPQQQLNQ